MIWSTLMQVVGGGLAVVSLTIEFVAIAAMGCYPLRRILPVQSPIALQSAGCCGFTGGVLLLALGRWMAS